ncbi:valacyclovir hydrolase [Brachyhypopomus gauderio]|uniref:valacyclovir hydrolase n=1 Tax=Brachyhypopomus gauderio TaxID=698409 RepID=UPI004041BCF5
MATRFCIRGLLTVVRTVPATRSVSSMCVSSGRRAVNGVDLFYMRTGEGDHPILLLPGVLGSGHTDFAPQLDKLDKRRFTVVAWDPRGYGRSRPPHRDFPPDFFHRDAKDAVDLMQALGFRRFSLLGWSDGGVTALIAAAVNPTLIRRVVVWGANAYVSEQDVQIYNAIRDTSLWSERMRQPMVEMYGVQYFTHTWGKWVDAICQFKSRPQGSICRELLQLIDCPTLIVHGAKDSLVPSFHPEFLLHNIHSSRLHVMSEGKHNLHLRFATEFNSLVEDFLSQ